MKRYQPAATMNIPEDPDGTFVLFSDCAEILQSAIMFAANHTEEIENGEGDFVMLKPYLAMLQGPGSKH